MTDLAALSPAQLAALELLVLEEEACAGFGPSASPPPGRNRAVRRRLAAAVRARCTPAPTCAAALTQATQRAPRRRRASDGICGDQAHQARTSDHNPAADGFAHAFDYTHDPANGADAHAWAEELRRRCASGVERRVKYIISNRRIASAFEGWRWRPYGGSNPHSQHVHVSVTGAATHDTRTWFAEVPAPPPPLPPAPAGPQVVGMAWRRPAGSAGTRLGWQAAAWATWNDLFAQTSAALRGEPMLLITRPTGYWLAGADGAVYAFDAPYLGGANGGRPLSAPVVGIFALPAGDGYWLVAADGGIFSFGAARFYGSLGGVPLRAPIVGGAASPSGRGYWLVAADGGVFAFGDARFHGGAAGAQLSAPIVGIAPTEAGDGYWLAGADGGVFGLGDAAYKGNGRGVARTAVVGIAGTSTGEGYWLLTAGWPGEPAQLLAFGDAARYPAPPAVGAVDVAAIDAGGYGVQPDGGLFAFGSPPWAGALPGWTP